MVRLCSLLNRIVALFSALAVTALGETAGIVAPGTAQYPNNGFGRTHTLQLFEGGAALGTVCEDTQRNCVYFTSPPMKFDLATFRPVESLTRLNGAGVVDLSRGKMYVCDSLTVHRIDLETFREDGTLTLVPPGDAVVTRLESAALDAATGRAYFAGGNAIFGINLDSLAQSAVHVRISERAFKALAFDTASGTLLACSNDAPPRVHRFSTPGLNPVDSLVLETECPIAPVAAIDPGDRTLLVATIGYDTWPPLVWHTGEVIRVSLASFTQTAKSTLPAPGDSVVALILDAATDRVVVGRSPVWDGMVIPADWTPQVLNSNTLSEIPSPAFPELGALMRSGLFLTSSGKLLIGESPTVSDNPDAVKLLDGADFSVESAHTLLSRENIIYSVLVDETADTGLLTMDYMGNRSGFVKFRPSDLSRVDWGPLPATNEILRGGVMDKVRNAAYFTKIGATKELIRVSLDTLEVTATLPLPGQDGYPMGMVLTPDASRLIVSFDSSLPPLLINLDTFSQEGSVPLSGRAIGWAVDSSRNAAFAALKTGFTKVQRIDLGTFASTGTISYAVAFEDDPTAIAIDPEDGVGILTTMHGAVTRFDLDSMTRLGGAVLGSWNFRTLVGDTEADTCFATRVAGPSGEVYRIDGETLVATQNEVVDARGGNILATTLGEETAKLYLGVNTGETPAFLAKLATSPKGAIHATRVLIPTRAIIDEVSLYTHEAAGSVRLAVYGEGAPRPLLWSSAATPVTQPNSTLSIPIPSGTPPELVLDPGYYWLAWQTNSSRRVGSYSQGGMGSGFLMDHLFGEFPASISAPQVEQTDANWTQYVSYRGASAAGYWESYP